MQKALTVILLFLSTYGYGQNTLVLLDSKTKVPISDAFVKYKVLANNYQDFVVSNSEGKVKIKSSGMTIVIFASHINYTPYQDTVSDFSNNTIYLLPAAHDLSEVVVTGQYQPQAASKSIHKIKSITSEQIIAKGARNLEEVLNTSLNIRLDRDPATGTMGMNLQGISGQNVKILIDGIPLIGRLDGQVDLNQIDINQIAKIEIVKGPMAVSYGSNAMGGVINIITKQFSPDTWNVNIGIDESSAREKYGLQEGAHNFHINGGYNITNNLYSQLAFGRTYFAGYNNSTERDSNWDPKTQYTGNLLLKYIKVDTKVSYSFSYLNSIIENEGKIIGVLKPQAVDEDYSTNRYVHTVNLGQKLSNTARFNASIAYTDYQRLKRQFIINFVDGTKLLASGEGTQDTTTLKSINLRGAFIKNANQSNTSFEAGYDFNIESGNGGRILGPADKKINDFGFFGSVSFSGNKWEVKPGVRVAYNTIFSTPIIPSVNLKLVYSPSTTFRGAYGRGFRAPTIKELYFDFRDANHQVFGNENLAPEDGHHLDIGVTIKGKHNNMLRYKSEIGVFYNTISGKIDFGFEAGNENKATYINLNQFKSLGIEYQFSFKANKFSIESGFSLTGATDQIDKAFLYTPEVIFNVNLELTDKISIGTYYKFTGEKTVYNVISESEITKSKIASYHWLDLTSVITLSKSIKTIIGIKNMLDVTDIKGGRVGGPIHGSGGVSSISYGRSAFVKLEININGNKTTKGSQVKQ